MGAGILETMMHYQFYMEYEDGQYVELKYLTQVQAKRMYQILQQVAAANNVKSYGWEAML